MFAGIKNGSLSVVMGDDVQSGKPLAGVGTSHKNTEPHLHIHASSSDPPDPMLFDGRFLARGDMVSK